jgi:hypothetical protein
MPLWAPRLWDGPTTAGAYSYAGSSSSIHSISCAGNLSKQLHLDVTVTSLHFVCIGITTLVMALKLCRHSVQVADNESEFMCSHLFVLALSVHHQ